MRVFLFLLLPFLNSGLANECVELFNLVQKSEPLLTLMRPTNQLFHQTHVNSSLGKNQKIIGPKWMTEGGPYFQGDASTRHKTFAVKIKPGVQFLGVYRSGDFDEAILKLNEMYRLWRAQNPKSSIKKSLFSTEQQRALQENGAPTSSYFYEDTGIAGVFVYKQNREGKFRTEYILLNPLAAEFHPH